MSTPILDRVLGALKAMLSTPIVDGKHSVFQVFSTLIVVRILTALKAIVNRNVNSHC